MAKIVMYRWRVRDRSTGRIRVTSYHATEEEIRRLYPDAEPEPGTLEERESDDNEFGTGIQRGPRPT
jgi:hypothetical protein